MCSYSGWYAATLADMLLLWLMCSYPGWHATTLADVQLLWLIRSYSGWYVATLADIHIGWIWTQSGMDSPYLRNLREIAEGCHHTSAMEQNLGHLHSVSWAFLHKWMLALVHYLSRCYIHSICPSQMPLLKHILYNMCTHTHTHQLSFLAFITNIIHVHAIVLEKLRSYLHSASLAIVSKYSVKNIWNRLDN